MASIFKLRLKANIYMLWTSAIIIHGQIGLPCTPSPPPGQSETKFILLLRTPQTSKLDAIKQRLGWTTCLQPFLKMAAVKISEIEHWAWCLYPCFRYEEYNGAPKKCVCLVDILKSTIKHLFATRF